MERLTRRQALALSMALASKARAQSSYPGVAYREYSRCWPDFLRDLAKPAYERRNRALAALTSPAAISRRQDWVAATFWRLVGGQPERTPLRARTLGAFERPGYRLEKIVYESQPGFVVPANLYLPTTGTPPYPGVLFQMGHSLNGKANEPYQKCCQGLARLGHVVLAFDPMGQGERTYYPAPSGLTRFGSADTEHSYPGKQMLLVGDTATRLQVWDAVRSLDYLAGRPEVDPKRLGSTGQSGGGTLTMLLAAVDKRLAAAAVSSGNTENFACANFDPPGSTDDAEQDLITSGPSGFDRWDLLYPLAPKPLLILVSARDFFGTYSPRYLASGREEFEKLGRVYSVLGRKEHLQWAETPLPHGLSYYPRLRIYNWFERWLKGTDKVIEQEPEVMPERDPQTWAGPTGNAMRDFGSITPFQLVQQRGLGMHTPRVDTVKIRMALGIDPGSAAVPAVATMSSLGKVPSGALSVEAVEVSSAKHVWLPAWLFTPAKVDGSSPVILLLDERGRNQHWREGGLAEQMASRGRLVCAADLRGIGDLKPEVGRGAPGYTITHDEEEEYAWASLVLGRSLLGQRVVDILALVHALVSRGNVALVASGRLTVPALFAAALDERIPKVYLSGGLVSFQSVAQSETYQCPLANIVPKMLACTDLPALAEHVAPRKVHLAGCVDASGRRMDLGAVRKAYPYANVEMSEEPEWTAERLIG